MASGDSTIMPVVTQHNDNSRTGATLRETALTPVSVSSPEFGKLFTRSVDGEIYAQPLYLPQVVIPGKGTHNVVYVATMHNSVYAFDADQAREMEPLWHRALESSVVLQDTNIGPGNYVDIAIEVGIVSTPVIDRGRNTIYVLTASKDPSGYSHWLHALDLTTGGDLFDGPTRIDATFPGAGDGSVNGQLTFTDHRQLQRSALTLANNQVYAAFASYGDAPPYHGWVIGFDANTLQRTSVHVSTPNLSGGGIWMAGQGLAVDAVGNLYYLSGNSTTEVTNPAWHPPDGTDLPESVVKLSPSLQVLDWFAPYNSKDLDRTDYDLGSAGPLLIPGTDRLLAGGKQSKFYELDTGALGGLQTVHTDGVPNFWVEPDSGYTSDRTKTKHIHGGPVTWTSARGQWIYVWPENSVLRAYAYPFTITEQTCIPVSMSTTNDPTGVQGGSPGMPGGFLSISANGNDPESGIVWAAHPYLNDANQQVVDGILRAYKASDLTQELWNSKKDAGRDDVGKFAKFCPPTIANGKVYLATFSNQLVVYGLGT
jgi:hypothetical protein